MRFNVYCGGRGVAVYPVGPQHWTFRDVTANRTIVEEQVNFPGNAHDNTEVEVGNYKKRNPLSFSCLQGHRYEWSFDIEVLVKQTNPIQGAITGSG